MTSDNPYVVVDAYLFEYGSDRKTITVPALNKKFLNGFFGG